MASRLDQLIAAFASQTDPAVAANIKKGRKALAENTPLPRITFIASGGQVLPPDQVGGGLLKLDNGQQVRDQIRRVRLFTLTMVLQGRNDEESEQMLHNAIAAWEAACSGSVDFDNEQWPDQADGVDSYETHGVPIRLDVKFMIPVYAVQRALTYPQTQAHDNTFTPAAGLLYGPSGSYGSGKYKPGETISF